MGRCEGTCLSGFLIIIAGISVALSLPDDGEHPMLYKIHKNVCIKTSEYKII